MIYVAGAGAEVRTFVAGLLERGTQATCAEYASRDVPEAEKSNAELNAILARTLVLLVPGTWESDPAALLDALFADAAGIRVERAVLAPA